MVLCEQLYLRKRQARASAAHTNRAMCAHLPAAHANETACMPLPQPGSEWSVAQGLETPAVYD